MGRGKTPQSWPRFSLGQLMAMVVALAPGFALVRIHPFLGTMAAILGVELAILAMVGARAGPVAWRLVVAVGVSVAMVAGWFVVRDLATELGYRITNPGDLSKPAWRDLFSMMTGGSDQAWGLARWTSLRSHARRLGSWEFWSLIRWWLGFGILTWLLTSRWLARLRRDEPVTSRAEASRRLLGFAPWRIVLDMGSLVMALVLTGFRAIPEPSTIWGAPLGDLRLFLAVTPITTLFQCVRLGLPFLVVGSAYFQGVAGWSRGGSLRAVLIVLPVAALGSAIWSGLYVLFFEWGIVPN